MTIALDEFTEWRDSVETRLGKLEDVSDRNKDTLRSMDGDFSQIQVEFRAQRGMLQALHLTQNQHTKTLAEHTETLAEHTKTLAEHSAALRKLETGQAKVLAGVQAILGLLQSADGGDS